MISLKRIKFSLVVCLIIFIISGPSEAQEKKVRFGVAGITHGHVGWIYGKMDNPEYEFVGFAEPDKSLAMQKFKENNIPVELWFPSLQEMIQKADLDAVVAFGSIYEHLEVVKACAPEGIHVMVEKPLAVNMSHASEMAKLAKSNNILLLTNYETSWWSSTHKIVNDARNNELGIIRKIVVHDGHMGPKEIGVSEEFFEWLTDPVLNGGGAVIDFGCYGANLSTAIMKNERPHSVTGILQQLKPDIYPDVDDEATIVITYPSSQTIIQASWNWPYHRKDIEVYGTESLEVQMNPNLVQKRIGNTIEEIELESLPSPGNDPFLYFTKSIKGEVEIGPLDLYSLENNMVVMEILDAAIQSAKKGATIYLDSIEK